MRRLLPVLLLSGLLFACGRPANDFVVPGKTSAAALRQEKGAPLRVAVPSSRPQAQLLDYPGGTSYQIEHKVVVGIASQPASDEERTLQYWRHKWRGKSQRFEEIPGSPMLHGKKVYQLVAPGEGMAVVYDSSIDRVVRVVRYGSR